jgi:hypothetical protein
VDPELVFPAGAAIEASVSHENMHFFDPQGGAALR